ncbi:hypothetical protein GCM10010371_22380 [Streptomyces subrutilus]|uniref:DUF6777 domain-containing protein n=1 Tax=Streptomyces subrutilus TaxID=36818 RepID=A0A5P2UEW5_9ACTN|nr:DUF6777 domain-containing protein [Streptomyces subrutilus]QEU77816.1 hypothetical protein CP968_05560 [Streptomyces subrutilus]GGZ62486.1 hypothetical protein GCM10010371_22380 [Streptomyces subrutilus]
MHAPTPPTPRQAPRRHATAGAALFAVLGLLAAGCGGSDAPPAAAGAESQEVHLQPVVAAGPDPFTASSATRESAPVQPPLPNPTGQGIRTVNAATPGLYGGTQRLGSCDVEQQVGFLTADDAKARAFAQASGIAQEKIPDFLRGLTPVVLRADTRVTSHGFRDGRGESFQSVLQAGTAVLVDGHGMPRVRCACGNPLLAPRAPKGSPVDKGEPWDGYQRNQVVVIEPTIQEIDNLVIVNIADNTWIERKTGDDGAQDRTPAVPPPFDPAEGIPDGPVTPSRPGDPCPSPVANGLARTAPPTPGGGAGVPQDVPAPGTTDCPPTGSTETAPKVPTPPDSPQQRPPSRPGEPSSQAPYDTPSEAPSDTAPEGTPSVPADPQTSPDPDGATPQPSDPYADPYAPSPDPNDPYADPYAVPDEPRTPADPGHSLESA